MFQKKLYATSRTLVNRRDYKHRLPQLQILRLSILMEINDIRDKWLTSVAFSWGLLLRIKRCGRGRCLRGVILLWLRTAASLPKNQFIKTVPVKRKLSDQKGVRP